jgi:RNA polymerase sigma-70 factor, ECF subfamily
MSNDVAERVHDSGAEALLLKAAQSGDRRAMETLLSQAYDRMWPVCRRICGSESDAADATQEAVILVMRNLAKFDGRSRFSTWCYRIATNASLDELRRRRRRPVPDDVTLLASRSDRDRVIEPDEIASARVDVDRAMARVPPEFRAALALRELSGLDYAEIGELLGIPPGTVRSRIARGRAALALHLGPQFPEEEQGASFDGGSFDGGSFDPRVTNVTPETRKSGNSPDGSPRPRTSS